MLTYDRGVCLGDHLNRAIGPRGEFRRDAPNRAKPSARQNRNG
jgi:hypothetical protein